VVVKIERILARNPLLRFVFQRWIVEIVARVAGSVGEELLRVSRLGVERRVRGFLSASYFGGTGLKIDRTLQVEGFQALKLGDNVTLYGGSHFVANRKNPIRIGSGTHVGRNSVLSGRGGIKIGSGCQISSGTLIYSITNQIGDRPTEPIGAQPPLTAAVTIGDDVWIGAGVTILPGVNIADHAIIGAGAVVNKDVEMWSIVAGVPAKHIRDRREAKNNPEDSIAGR